MEETDDGQIQIKRRSYFSYRLEQQQVIHQPVRLVIVDGRLDVVANATTANNSTPSSGSC